jgi:hypothetical protein
VTRRSCRRSFASWVVISLALAPASAMADMTKIQCIDADTKGQDLRRDGKLSAARDQLRTCGDLACPPILRDDCSRRLDELERAQPTIIFDAKDASGRDVMGVRVSVDGKSLADKLDGTALQVDPGEHLFTFSATGRAPVTETLVVKEGEKGRRERIVISSPPLGSRPALPPSSPTPSVQPISELTPPSPSPPPTAKGMTMQKILGLAIGGVGVAGIAVGSVFGVLTFSAASQQNGDCLNSTQCKNYPQALLDHKTAVDDGTVSTVAFIAGGALLMGGAALFFAAGRSSERSATTELVVVPSVGSSGGLMSLRGEF